MNVSLARWQKYIELGIKYLGEGNTADAEEYFLKGYREAEELSIPVVIAFSLRLLATAQVKNNKLNEAEKGFKRALQICQKLNNNKGISEAKAGLASVYFIRGKLLKAADLYNESIIVYPKEASALRLAMLYTDLGQVYLRLKKWQSAEEAFVNAIILCKNCDYTKGEGEIKLFLGEIKYGQGKLSEAQGTFKEAAKMFAVIGDEVLLANALQYLAFILFEKNLFQEALLYQNRVVALFLKNKQYSEASESYYLLGNILQYLKILDEAENSLRYSLKYYSGSEFGFAVRYQSLAVISIMKKEYIKAKEYYFNALRFFQFFGDGSKIGEISEELTFLLKYEDIFFKENWLGSRSIKLDIPKYEIMLRLANNFKNKGNIIAALKCSWKALEIAKNLNYETEKIENFIQYLSEIIRKRIK